MTSWAGDQATSGSSHQLTKGRGNGVSGEGHPDCLIHPRELGEAIDHFRNAVALWSSIGYRWGEAAALHKLGDAYARQQQWEEATDLLKPR
jgi:hypothetical protein